MVTEVRELKVKRSHSLDVLGEKWNNCPSLCMMNQCVRLSQVIWTLWGSVETRRHWVIDTVNIETAEFLKRRHSPEFPLHKYVYFAKPKGFAWNFFFCLWKQQNKIPYILSVFYFDLQDLTFQSFVPHSHKCTPFKYGQSLLELEEVL